MLTKRLILVKRFFLLLLASSWREEESSQGAEIRNRRTEDKGQQAELLTLNIHLSHLTNIYIKESAMELS